MCFVLARARVCFLLLVLHIVCVARSDTCHVGHLGTGSYCRLEAAAGLHIGRLRLDHLVHR
jgi:hypothetical protein